MPNRSGVSAGSVPSASACSGDIYSIVPHQCSRLRHAIASYRAGQPKIHYQNPSILVAHYVLRLQIAVNHSHAMRRLQRAAHLLHDFHRFFR